jgi:hypothetical protein
MYLMDLARSPSNVVALRAAQTEEILNAPCNPSDELPSLMSNEVLRAVAERGFRRYVVDVPIYG